MIVGGYTLDLYCDFPDESWEHRGYSAAPGGGFAQFIHDENGAGARKMARRAGWKFERGGMRVICPSCIQKERILTGDE